MSPIIFPGQAPESFAGLLKELSARLGEVEFAAVAEAVGGQMLPDGLLLPSFGGWLSCTRAPRLWVVGTIPSWARATCAT